MGAVRKCPALMIAAAGSSHGKTTVTAGLAYHHRKAGKRVRVFKVGPDFLDPTLLEFASGNRVENLDLWMVGEIECRRLLAEAAHAADLILIEGVMGLFDGSPSTADLAEHFGIPLLCVINAGHMSETFHAVALGLASYRSSLNFVGVLANNVGSVRHAQLLQQSAGAAAIEYLGALRRNDAMSLPSRHLGLVPACEIADLECYLETISARLHDLGITRLLPEVPFCNEWRLKDDIPKLLCGRRIVVARDRAFSFLYPANLTLLQSMGAQMRFYSPLKDEEILDDDDAVLLPGGYPELHLAELSQNKRAIQSLRRHFERGKNIYAECGGMLYLFDSLTDRGGNSAPMAGILSGHARLQKRLSALGFQSAVLPEGTLRGHTFHYSLTESPLLPAAHGQCRHIQGKGEAIYLQDKLWASYLHLYLPSCPEAAASLFN